MSTLDFMLSRRADLERWVQGDTRAEPPAIGIATHGVGRPAPEYLFESDERKARRLRQAAAATAREHQAEQREVVTRAPFAGKDD